MLNKLSYSQIDKFMISWIIPKHLERWILKEKINGGRPFFDTLVNMIEHLVKIANP